MPKLDKTGPTGAGPLTGRGLGPCDAGTARGRAYGLGRQLGCCPYPDTIDKKQEKELLKKEKELIDKRLKELS